MTEKGVISKGMYLAYKAGEATDYTKLKDLQEVPELGGDKEAIDVTTMDDEAFVYTDGLINYGDSIAFKFLYETEQFGALQEIEYAEWQVVLPDGRTATFGGKCSVKFDGVSVNAPLTYTLSIKPNTKMTWAKQ